MTRCNSIKMLPNLFALAATVACFTQGGCGTEAGNPGAEIKPTIAPVKPEIHPASKPEIAKAEETPAPAPVLPGVQDPPQSAPEPQSTPEASQSVPTSPGSTPQPDQAVSPVVKLPPKGPPITSSFVTTSVPAVPAVSPTVAQKPTPPQSKTE